MDDKKLIIEYVKQYPNCSSKEIFQGYGEKRSLATVKRILLKLIQERLIITTGKGKSTRYHLSPIYKLFEPIDFEKYYEKEIDEREINESFNFSIISEILPEINLFSVEES